MAYAKRDIVDHIVDHRVAGLETLPIPPVTYEHNAERQLSELGSVVKEGAADVSKSPYCDSGPSLSLYGDDRPDRLTVSLPAVWN